ncbi:MAG: hypothetical protein AB7S38_01430 [Vulcanimicrobiota bacterium]
MSNTQLWDATAVVMPANREQVRAAAGQLGLESWDGSGRLVRLRAPLDEAGLRRALKAQAALEQVVLWLDGFGSMGTWYAMVAARSGVGVVLASAFGTGGLPALEQLVVNGLGQNVRRSGLGDYLAIVGGLLKLRPWPHQPVAGEVAFEACRSGSSSSLDPERFGLARRHRVGACSDEGVVETCLRQLSIEPTPARVQRVLGAAAGSAGLSELELINCLGEAELV